MKLAVTSRYWISNFGITGLDSWMNSQSAVYCTRNCMGIIFSKIKFLLYFMMEIKLQSWDWQFLFYELQILLFIYSKNERSTYIQHYHFWEESTGNFVVSSFGKGKKGRCWSFKKSLNYYRFLAFKKAGFCCVRSVDESK